MDDGAHEADPRFTLANERTFLAWSRTAIALIGGGLAAGQLLDFRYVGLRIAVALPPILMGALVVLAARARWAANDAALARGEPLAPTALARPLALGLVALALVLAAAVVADALSS